MSAASPAESPQAARSVLSTSITCAPLQEHHHAIHDAPRDGTRARRTMEQHGRTWMRASDLYGRIVERVRERPYLLIVDEADRLRMDCFEMLRDFWDDARLPILLVGNEVLNEKINRQHERLLRRIRARFDQPPLREADLRAVIEFMGYEVADDEFSLLSKLVRGSPGFAEALLENATEIAASQKAKRGIEALAGAVRYFPTLRKAV